MITEKNNSQYIDFLGKVFPFSKLDLTHIYKLSGELETIELRASETIYIENEPARYLYFVEQGKVEISKNSGKRKRLIATLAPGDFFGEACLGEAIYPESATAREISSVIRLKKDQLNLVLNEYPEIKSILLATYQSRDQIRKKRFSWLSTNEVVYYFVRKHPFFLLLKLSIPAALIFGFLYLLRYSSLSNSDLLFLGAVAGIALMILVGFWLWINWSNDFYAVTSRRVIWIERTVLFYDSRQEAPLDTILSSNIQAFQILMMLIDYGNVIVMTYTGSIPMKRIQNPDLMVSFINGLQSRALELARKSESQKMEAMIGERLGVDTGVSPFSGRINLPPTNSGKSFQDSKGYSGGLLNLRSANGDAITYRKHWFVLIKKIWWQTFLILSLGLIAGYLVGNSIIEIPAASVILLLMICITLLWLYSFIDWRNDIYVVTLDKILDIERKPLGRENKKSAPLENILSLEHKRVGLLGLMMNYGTVTINIGTEKFIFWNVYNPARVQREIFDRLTALRQREEREKVENDRERMADYLVAYHEQNRKSKGQYPLG